ncbi:MAG: hypothetical protein RL329_512 [Bacteroidota bacterium]
MLEQQPDISSEKTPVSETDSTSETVVTLSRHPPLWKRMLRWTRKVAFYLIGAWIAVIFLFRLETVQNWVIGEVTHALSNALHTKVELQKFYFDYNGSLVINGLHINDLKGDTLLYAKDLSADLDWSPLIFNQIVWINTVYLAGVTFNLHRPLGSYDYNLQFILDYFDPPSDIPSLEKPPLDIRIGHIHLRDVLFDKNDSVGGQRLTTRLVGADIHTQSMDFPNNFLHFSEVKIHQPKVHLTQFVATPLPPRPAKPAVPVLNDTLNQGFKRQPFRMAIDVIRINDGKFDLDDWERTPKPFLPKYLLDFDHLKVLDIQASMRNILFLEGVVTGAVDGISLQEKSGFVIQKCSVNETRVSATETQLNGIQIITPYSILGDTFVMKHPNGLEDFKDFNNTVYMDARIHTSKVMLGDIMAFAPPLEKNDFFVKNKKSLATMEGRLLGRVNSLKAYDINLKLNEYFKFKGDIETHNLAVTDEEIMNMKIRRLESNVKSLRQLLPGFNPPAEVDKLGNLDFTGSFEGFFEDFVVNGVLKTDIGQASGHELRLNLKPGKDDARYSGDVAFKDFDLGKWADNPDLGKITFKAYVKDGLGITKKHPRVNLTGKVESFWFKKYEYRNLTVRGELRSDLFEGHLTGKDDNMDFNFDGTVNFAGEKPLYDFKSEVYKLDLKRLNLAQDDLVVMGNIVMKLTGDKLSNLSGEARVNHLKLILKQKDIIEIDSLSLKSYVDESQNKHFWVDSEVFLIDLVGKFDIEAIPEALKQHFALNHPRLTKDLHLLPDNKIIANQSFTYNIKIKDTKNLTYLMDSSLKRLTDLTFKGNFDNQLNQLGFELSLEELHYGDLHFREIWLKGDRKNHILPFELTIYHTRIGDEPNAKHFENIAFNNTLYGDTLKIGVASDTFSSSFQFGRLDVNAILIPLDTLYRLSFDNSTLHFFNDKWAADTGNYIVFNKNYLKFNNFDFKNGDYSISFESINNKGIHATLENFDLASVNKYVNDNHFRLSGKYKVEATTDNIFKMTNLNIKGSMERFFVNKEDRGRLDVDVTMEDLKSSVYAYINLLKAEEREPLEQLVIEGRYYPNDMRTAKGFFKKNDIAVDLKVTNLPFKLLNYLIESGMSGTEGRVEGDLNLTGQYNYPETKGKMRLYNAAFTVDYLKNRIFIPDAIVKINNTMFDATGGIMKDAEGNTALVEGGLTHDRLKNWGMKARLIAPKFVCLNTTRADNPLFYGKAIGAGDIRFTGNFDKPDIKVIATAGKGTKIVFPFTKEQNATELKFIKFKNKNIVQDSTVRTTIFSEGVPGSTLSSRVKDLNGVSFDMNLTLTPEAETNLIFDEVAGDNIKAWGTGDLQLTFERGGEMEMKGQYNIVKGDYLFTLLRVVNKNFAIKEGGFIKWNGSPFDAQISIDAAYKGLTTSPHNLISEYVNGSDELKREANKPTPVDLTLRLQGAMLKPDVSFEVGFPKLTGQLKSFVDNKVRTLRQEPNELNRQMFGLVMVGSFLPPDIALLGAQELQTGGVNTAAELLSSMMNRFLADYVKGVDLQIGYNIASLGNIQSIGKAEHRVQFKAAKTLGKDERWNIAGGVGVERKIVDAAELFVGGDFMVEYAITEDRRFKIRISQTYDQILEGVRYRPALGIRYRREFNSISNFMSFFKKEKSK